MFATPLRVEKIGKNTWELLTPLVYKGSEIIVVPQGFKTDFASVPRPAWWFCAPAAGNHAKPAVLHDFLCETSSDQKRTDNLFLEAMKANGVGWSKRHALYWAVRGYQTAKGKYFRVS